MVPAFSERKKSQRVLVLQRRKKKKSSPGYSPIVIDGIFILAAIP